MGQAAKERERDRKARTRLRVLRHYEYVTRNVSQTCRFFGISRTLFYRWRERDGQDAAWLDFGMVLVGYPVDHRMSCGEAGSFPSLLWG